MFDNVTAKNVQMLVHLSCTIIKYKAMIHSIFYFITFLMLNTENVWLIQ